MLRHSRVLVASLVATTLFAGYALAAQTGFLFPVMDGYYEDWDTSEQTSDHYTLVDDEFSCNGNQDYIYTIAPGGPPPVTGRDSFKLNLSSIPNGSTITKIEILPCASSYRSGPFYTESTLDTFYRYGGSNSQGVSYTLSESTTTVELATSTWDNLGISKFESTDIQIGVKHMAGSRGSKVSRLRAILTYE